MCMTAGSQNELGYRTSSITLGLAGKEDSAGIQLLPQSSYKGRGRAGADHPARCERPSALARNAQTR